MSSNIEIQKICPVLREEIHRKNDRDQVLFAPVCVPGYKNRVRGEKKENAAIKTTSVQTFFPVNLYN